MDATVDNTGAEGSRTLGQTLAAERERHGLSRNDVAHRLHMSPFQVEALENGEYERLPKGTFLRGFVRNYAKVVGLEAQPLLSMLAEAKPGDRAPRVIVPSENIRFDPLGERFSGPYVRAAMLALVAVVLAFAAMYWWLFIRPTPPGAVKHNAMQAQPAASSTNAPTPAPRVESPPPAEGASAGTAAPASTPSTPSPSAPSSPGTTAKGTPTPPPAKTPSTATTTTKAPSTPATTTAKAAGTAMATNATAAAGNAASAPTPPAAGEKALHFRFKGESWVEVRDARGKVVFQSLNPAGSDADVHGRPPLAVIVGNAAEVEMTEGDRPFPLEPHTKGEVARFTIQ